MDRPDQTFNCLEIGQITLKQLAPHSLCLNLYPPHSAEKIDGMQVECKDWANRAANG